MSLRPRIVQGFHRFNHTSSSSGVIRATRSSIPAPPHQRQRHLHPSLNYVDHIPAQPRIARALVPKRSSLTTPTPTLFVAAVLSIGVAYLGFQYSSRVEAPEPEGDSPDPSLSATQLAMAPYGNAPGRPGNLTPDQQTTLKEMWIALSDISGMSEASPPSDDTSSISKDTTTTTETPQKKKSRFGFGRKKEKEADVAASVENDKHGQAKEYQQALASLTPEQLRDALWSMSKHDDPDALLLRFLRARKWDVQAALIMLVSTMHWRSQEMHVDDDIMVNGERQALQESKSSDAAEKKEGDDFMAQLRMGKSFLHGIDKDGRPCCYVRVKLHRQGEQSERSLERFTVYTIETARMMLRPPVDTATIVFDMTDFSMANMDYTPVKFMIKCFEANYPESLGSVVVYKSPWIFQGIWKIIRGWLDPVVASKVHFASGVSELETYIPRAQIMKELGGDEDYVYTYTEPQEGEDAAMQDVETREKLLAERKELVASYEAETQSWIHNLDAGEGRPRLAQRLAENYWKLDPFVRARSLYDRTGVIQEGGKLDFYPKKAAAAAAAGDEVD